MSGAGGQPVTNPYCSFCSKRENQVLALIKSDQVPGVFICNECVQVCNAIIRKTTDGGAT